MDKKDEIRSPDKLRDGFSDGFKPLRALDLSQIDSFEEMLTQMGNAAFGARNLGEALEVCTSMLKDPDCFVVGTFSGAMTMAKMGLVLCEMIERGFLDAVVATGALVTHGLVENVGSSHFKYEKGMDDRELYKHGYNRVYDTLEIEKNLDDISLTLHSLWDKLDHKQTYSSVSLLSGIGEFLSANTQGRGILKSAYQKGIPVYIPAFTDSEMGLDFAIHNRLRQKQGKAPLQFNPFSDLEDYTKRIQNAERTGLFTIGGGVPRNWAQQVGPYLEIIYRRIEKENQYRRFRYGVRICPEPVHWGGLSGCTYSEGVSWGKFLPKEEGGQWAEVLCDATIAWPMLLKGLIERFDREGFKRDTAASKNK